MTQIVSISIWIKVIVHSISLFISHILVCKIGIPLQLYNDNDDYMNCYNN